MLSGEKATGLRDHFAPVSHPLVRPPYVSTCVCVCVCVQVSPDFKARVMSVLEQGSFSESRASKMSQEDLLALLAAFNAQGIHFV